MTAAPEPADASAFVRSDRFADLVSRIPSLIDDRGRVVERCLVRSRSTDVLVMADLAPAISPMPTPSETVIEAARRAGEVRLVSRWGMDGELGPYVATFTHHAPPEAGLAIVVFVEADSSFIRSTSAVAPREDGLTDVRLAARLSSATGAGGPLVVVTAGPAVPLARLEAVLTALDATAAPIALGVAFVADEPVEDVAVRSSDGANLCASLPPASTDVTAGSLSPESIRDAVRSLDPSLRACVSLGDPRTVGRGGRIRIAVRVGASGRTEERCALEDSLGDPRVRACILDAVGAHAFPVPAPIGTVDVTFPLTIRRSTDADQSALCR